MKEVYNITKILSKEIKTRWKEHFNEVLNHPEPPELAEIDLEEIDVLPIKTEPPTIDEVRSIIKDLKNGKAPGIDNITSELLRADPDTSSAQIHKLLTIIWKDEKIPSEWKKGLIMKMPKKDDLTNCENWRGITLISKHKKY